MKYCRCINCGYEINLKRNTDYRVIAQGYKYPLYKHYAECPSCGNKQEVQSKELPFSVRWKAFRETCL